VRSPYHLELAKLHSLTLDFDVGAEVGMLDDLISREAKGNCEKAFAPAREGLEKLEYAVLSLTKGRFMDYVETKLLQLSEGARSCLSHYGAQNGLSAGYSWQTKSYDATNVIYAGVWEAWKDVEHFQAYPRCRKVTAVNDAGKTMEAVLGVAWLQVHGRGDLAPELRQRLDDDQMHAFSDVAAEVFNFVLSDGLEPVRWVLTLERGLKGYNEVWNACPWIRCTTEGYNSVCQRKHIEALHFGFASGTPFIKRGVDPLSREYWYRYCYAPGVQDQLRQEVDDDVAAVAVLFVLLHIAVCMNRIAVRVN
jgi:hypothetical protein